jgi:hypothetical protein
MLRHHSRAKQSEPFDAVTACLSAAGSRLAHSTFLELKSVSCHCDRGQLVLRGRVSSYYLKQMAQALMTDLGACCPVSNCIEVVDPPLDSL